MEDFHHMCFEILDCELISIGCLTMGIPCMWVKGVSLQNSFIQKDLPGAAGVSVAQANVYDNYPAWGFPDHVGYRNTNPRPSRILSACGYKVSEENFYPIQIIGCCGDRFVFFFLSTLSLAWSP